MTWRYQKRYYVVLPVRCRITDCITSVRPSVRPSVFLSTWGRQSFPVSIDEHLTHQPPKYQRNRIIRGWIVIGLFGWRQLYSDGYQSCQTISQDQRITKDERLARRAAYRVTVSTIGASHVVLRRPLSSCALVWAMTWHIAIDHCARNVTSAWARFSRRELVVNLPKALDLVNRAACTSSPSVDA